MAVNAQSVGDRAAAENVLTGALNQAFALSEAYPDLKANTEFMRLQEELTSTENKVAFARQFYSDSVMTYNTRIEVFRKTSSLTCSTSAAADSSRSVRRRTRSALAVKF